MEYGDSRMVNTFIQRTQENLKIIASQDPEKSSKYEVTQAVNSLLGLLIIPVERMKDTAMRKSFDHEIIELIDITTRNQNKPLLNQIRNCVAHGNIGFRAKVPDSSEIGFITLGCTKTSNKREFQAKISVDNLFKLTDKLCELLKDHKFA